MLHFGVLGLGNIAHRFVESLQKFEEADFYAGASYTEAKRKEFEEKYHPTITYDDYYKLLEDENIDIVYISVPHGMHYKWCKEALLHNKCVLVEKPAVLYADEMKELSEIAHKKNLFLLEAMKTRFLPLTEVLHNEINKGIIGNIISIENHFCFDLSENLPLHSYLFDKEMGGSLYDAGCYGLASVLDYIHCPVKEVENNVTYLHDVDVHDQVHILFESGQEAFVESSMVSDNNREMIIKGEKGTITLDPFYRPESARIKTNDGEDLTVTAKYINDDFHHEIEACLKGISYLKVEDERMSHQDSIDLINLMRKIKEI